MDDAPPPADHVLRPHHVTLLAILMNAYQDWKVSIPKSHKEIVEVLSSGPKADVPICATFNAEIAHIPHQLLTPDDMHVFLSTTNFLLSPKIDETPRFLRRSIFGYFTRRCFTSFVKLSYIGINRLVADYQAWVNDAPTAGYFVAQKDELTSDLLLFKTQADKKTWARAGYYEGWQKGVLTGDENLAVESLRRFFEQHFHDSHDSGYRQHGILSLIRMHYIKGEYAAARKLLTEAIDTARTSSDKVTLHHCLSLLHRIPYENTEKKPFLHEIQPDLHPLEILYDVKKLMTEENEQPLSAAFIKLFQAIALYDHWIDVQSAQPVESEQWAQHAAQSILWAEAGCEGLASAEQNVVMAFARSGEEGSDRLSVILNKAYKKARQGEYEEALSFLLHPSIWCGLTLYEYSHWSHQLWHILTLRATRRGQFRLYRQFLLPKRPNGPFNAREYFLDAEGEKMSPIRESLHQILRLKEHDQFTMGVDYLLKNLWHSEFLCKYGLYRTGIILLADIGLEFRMSKRSRRILEEIMPQIINGDDREQRAVACFTLARCIIAAEGSTLAAFQEAIPYLLMAESDFKKLEIYGSVKDVQYMLSIVYHNLDMDTERNNAAKRHADTEAHQRTLEFITFDEKIQEILQLSAAIGASLASR
ncbi:unnamed protein product [Cyclocybe aegerita]|uniref:Anaphase-promoting complex subunit 5 n=1 Tax=Cyclocybe aegerita TaxID=1973307 RepID=A0A8S0WDI6_CYCAE|nr:unnamed protein product [Cyclocybe aegerita]